MANLQNTNIFGTLDVKARTDSNTPQDGALVVSGGVGIGGNLNLGGNLGLGVNSITAGEFNGLTIVQATGKTLDLSGSSLTVNIDETGAHGVGEVSAKGPGAKTASIKFQGSPIIKGNGTISLGSRSLTLGNNLTIQTSGGITLTGGASGNSTINFPSISNITVIDKTTNQTISGKKTFELTARNVSSPAPYFEVVAPEDTGISAGRKSVGIKFESSKRTWNAGAILEQVEVEFQGPEINVNGTVTTAVNVDILNPTKTGTGGTTNNWALRTGNLLSVGNIRLEGSTKFIGDLSVGGGNLYTINEGSGKVVHTYPKEDGTAQLIKIDEATSATGLEISSNYEGDTTTSTSRGIRIKRDGNYPTPDLAKVYGIHSSSTATGKVEKTAGLFEVTGAGEKNTALYASASGGSSNIALEVGAGDVVFNQLTGSTALVLDGSKVVKSTTGSLTLNKNFKVSDGDIELVGVSGGSKLTLPATLTIGALSTAGNALYVKDKNEIGSEEFLSVSRGGTGIGALIPNVIYKGGKKKIDENTTVDILIPSSISETIVENKKLITLDSDVFVDGSLTVEGSTIFIETENLQTKDKNIELGVPAEGKSASDESAHEGGITLRGGEDKNKTITWFKAGSGEESRWHSSEDWDLAEGKAYKISNKTLLTPTALSFHDSGSITTPSNKTLSINSGGTGDLNVGTSGVKNITLGNKDGATNTTVRAGAGNLNLDATNVVVTNGKITIGEIESTPPVNVDLFSTTKEGNVDIATGLTSGKITIGGTSSTGISTLFPSTKGIVINLGSGATENAKIKSINIGASGLSGSTTNIVIGSATGTSNLTLNGAVTTGLNKGAVFVNNSGVLSSETALSVSRGGTGLSSVSAGQILIGETGGGFVATTLTGTTNEVNATPASGKITLSLPQKIHTGATPKFDKLGLGLTSGDAIDNSSNLTLKGGSIKSLSAVAGIGFTLDTKNAITGNLLEVRNNGTSKFRVDKDGNVATGGEIIGNATSASMLSGSPELWGQSFDGTGNILGNISGTGNITPSDNGVGEIGTANKRYRKAYVNEVVIGKFTWAYNDEDDSLDLMYSAT